MIKKKKGNAEFFVFYTSTRRKTRGPGEKKGEKRERSATTGKKRGKMVGVHIAM